MRLPTGCLPIGKYSRVIPIEQLLNMPPANPLIHLLLTGHLTTNPIKAILTIALLHHRIVVLEGRCGSGLEPTIYFDLCAGGLLMGLVLDFLELDDFVHEVDGYFLEYRRRNTLRRRRVMS